MIRVRKYNRTWHIYGEESLLSPWAKNVENISGTLVKKNAKRGVWLVSSDDGQNYYVKRERKFHLPFTVSKAEKEYLAFALLEEKGIPCVECSAWSATFDDSILVTKALPKAFQSLQKYWYMKPEADLKLLQNLCDLLAEIAKAGITHPDFHAGNLMTDGESIVLLDPVGIAEIEPTDKPEPKMLIPLVIAFGEIPMEQIAGMLHKSGLYETEESALAVLRQVEVQQHSLIEKEWEKRRKQILSGTSKFATEVEKGKFFRNSAWNAPLLKYPEDVLEEKEFSESEGKEIWVESFRSQLMKKECENVPVIYEKIGEKVRIYFLKDKKYSFFYGFR